MIPIPDPIQEEDRQVCPGCNGTGYKDGVDPQDFRDQPDAGRLIFEKCDKCKEQPVSKTLRDMIRRKSTGGEIQDKVRDPERLAALELGTTVEDIDQKLMDAHERAEKAEAHVTGLRSAILLERIAHARTKRDLWRERYSRSSEKLTAADREVEDLQAESRGYR